MRGKRVSPHGVTISSIVAPFAIGYQPCIQPYLHIWKIFTIHVSDGPEEFDLGLDLDHIFYGEFFVESGSYLVPKYKPWSPLDTETWGHDTA
jgi:hypothetical protein